jgi:hypothetical protein
LLKAFLRYRNGDKPEIHHFKRIFENYESPEYNYLIGVIDLYDLFQTDWLKRNETNVIILDD